MANSADVAIEELRKFQTIVFDNKVSPMELHTRSSEILMWIHRSKNTYDMSYEEIAKNFMKQIG
jgi:hypothetical protein